MRNKKLYIDLFLIVDPFDGKYYILKFQLQCVKQNTVSTLVCNIHLFNFPLSTCCGHLMLRSV